MSLHLLKSNLEPLRVMFGVIFYVFFQVVEAHIFPRFHFVAVDVGLVVGLADEDVVKLVLGEALPDGGLIYKGVDLAHLASHTHFFHQAALGGLGCRFSGAGMAAAGVGPKAGGMVLREGALLQEQFALGIKYKNGESSVKMRRDMRGLLLHLAYGLVVFIYKDYVFHDSLF